MFHLTNRTGIVLLIFTMACSWGLPVHALDIDCFCEQGDPDAAILSGNGDYAVGDRKSVDEVISGIVSKTLVDNTRLILSPSNSRYEEISVSDDGALVVFLSRDDSLVPSDSNGQGESVFLWRRSDNSLELLPVAGGGEQFPADAEIRGLRISGNGEYVLFHEFRSIEGMYRYRIADQSVTPVPNSDGWLTDALDISDDGDVLVWDSGDDVGTDSNGSTDVYLYRFSTDTFRIVSQTFQGGESYYGGYSASVTGDGRYVFFLSEDEDIIANDPTYWEDIYRYDTTNDSVTQIIGSQLPDTSNGRPYDLAVSDDGQWMFFQTVAAATAGDMDTDRDIYAMRPSDPTTLQLLSLTETGENGAGPISCSSCGMLSVSNDGSRVTFRWPEVLTADAPVTSDYLLNRGDVFRPVVSSVVLFPEGSVIAGSPLSISALATDLNTGNSDITTADYNVDGGAWVPLTATDGSFDSSVELLEGVLNTQNLLLGNHELCVRAGDSSQQFSVPACASFEVAQAPPSVEYILTCRHRNIWPQDGETALLQASTWGVDDQGITVSGHPVERLEIWYENDQAPVVVDDSGISTPLEWVTPTLTSGTRTYGCRAIIGEVAVFSGWKTFTVGLPDGDGAIPVLFTGPSANSVDIVFVPDVDSYSGVTDPEFINEVFLMIWTGFYRYDLYNRHQHRFNFWLSRNTGRVDRESDAGDSPRTLEVPSDWKENYSFADTAAIIHTDPFRGFSKANGFAAQNGKYRTARHEAAHNPFGLSDEYCCDTRYYEQQIFPNVYKTLASCESDAPNLGRQPEDCRSWVSSRNDRTYYSSEPDEGELMNGASKANPADIRRIEWMFEKCAEGEC